jgi:hypothetical protein
MAAAVPESEQAEYDSYTQVLNTNPDSPIDELDDSGNTPLNLGAMMGNSGGVRALLERGADKTIANHAGRTPAETARYMLDASTTFAASHPEHPMAPRVLPMLAKYRRITDLLAA